MATYRKPRADSRLGMLPEDARMRLLEWFTTPGMTISRIREEAERPYAAGGLGVKTSTGALSTWWSQHGPEYLIARRSQARSLAADLAAEVQARPAQFEAATIDAISQQAFTIAQQPGVQAKDVKALFGLILKVRDQETKKQELALQEAKFRETLKTDIERGLDALHTEIKGNAEALQLFGRMREIVLGTVGGKRS